MAVTMSPTTLGSLTVGSAMTPVTVAGAGGTGPYVFDVQSGRLPQGLTLVPSTGVISGTPQVAGDYEFVLVAEDSLGAVGSLMYQGSVAVASGAPNNLDYTGENMVSVTVSERVSGDHATGRLTQSKGGFITVTPGASTQNVPAFEKQYLQRDKVVN